MIALLQPLSTLLITSMLQALWMSDLLNGWFHVWKAAKSMLFISEASNNWLLSLAC